MSMYMIAAVILMSNLQIFGKTCLFLLTGVYFPSQFPFLLWTPCTSQKDYPHSVHLTPISSASSDSEKFTRTGALYTCPHEREMKTGGNIHRENCSNEQMQNTNCFYPSWLANNAKQHQQALECFIRYKLLKTLCFQLADSVIITVGTGSVASLFLARKSNLAYCFQKQFSLIKTI